VNLVLSTGRDPYTRWTDLQKARAAFAAEAFTRFGRRGHLRALHYFLVSESPRRDFPGLGQYQNTERFWEALCASAVWARYQGFGDWSRLIDRKHPDPLDSSDYSAYDPTPEFEPVEFTGDALRQSFMRGRPRFTTAGLSNYHLEVWVEKNTMNEAIRPAINRYDAVLQPLVGESSLERAVGAVERIRQHGKPARIFYISDFDPSGRQMPVSVARKLEFYSHIYDMDIRLKPIALTYEQVVEYRLPGIPTKTTDSRAASFVEQFGDRATELDALEALRPGVLRNIVASHLAPYVDEAKLKRIRDENDRLKDRYAAIVDQLPLNDLADALNEEAANAHARGKGLADEFEYPAYEHVVDEGDDWLLDTNRSESEQFQVYQAFRGK